MHEFLGQNKPRQARFFVVPGFLQRHSLICTAFPHSSPVSRLLRVGTHRLPGMNRDTSGPGTVTLLYKLYSAEMKPLHQ